MYFFNSCGLVFDYAETDVTLSVVEVPVKFNR